MPAYRGMLVSNGCSYAVVTGSPLEWGHPKFGILFQIIKVNFYLTQYSLILAMAQEVRTSQSRNLGYSYFNPKPTVKCGVQQCYTSVT